MMLPGTTISPPYFLTPSRRPRLSRPLREEPRPGGDLGPLADHQHLAELDRGPGLAGELLDRDDIVLGDLVLLAAGPDHSEHDTRRYGFPRTGCQPPTARTIASDGVTRPWGAHYRRADWAVNDAWAGVKCPCCEEQFPQKIEAEPETARARRR